VQHDEMEQQEREMRKENDAMKRSFTKKEWDKQNKCYEEYCYVW
jgi:hypothetical protein